MCAVKCFIESNFTEYRNLWNILKEEQFFFRVHSINIWKRSRVVGGSKKPFFSGQKMTKICPLSLKNKICMLTNSRSSVGIVRIFGTLAVVFVHFSLGLFMIVCLNIFLFFFSFFRFLFFLGL